MWIRDKASIIAFTVSYAYQKMIRARYQNTSEAENLDKAKDCTNTTKATVEKHNKYRSYRKFSPLLP